MYLNINKCLAICFSRKICPSVPCYTLNNLKLSIHSTVKDLGITLDNKLTFIHHYNNIISRANKALGCVKRFSKDFKNLTTLKTLYVAHVRSILEYGAIIWIPYYSTHIDRIERVQYRFFKFMKWKLPQSAVAINYSSFLDYMSLGQLQT